MKLPEAIEIVEAQAASHPAAKFAPCEPTERAIHKRKEWCKSITALDKTHSTGYSLVGDFLKKKEELEPNLFLLFTIFAGNRITKVSEPKWEYKDSMLVRKVYPKDNEGNIVFHDVDRLTTFEERRALLFDYDGERATLQHFTWLPSRSWARDLWKPVETWLENQPNIATKIEFWEAEVAVRTDSLRQAQQRLDALKRQSATNGEELDPYTAEWLKTAAVLGTKKATGRESLEN
ncbi:MULTISPECIES: hypothetical protein [unclassified Microcoleus]|uniref:hypothetical protein n=1 Tax=unclassified Microcoleus TaxID=2642155 RepID=UPI002FCF10EE